MPYHLKSPNPIAWIRERRLTDCHAGRRRHGAEERQGTALVVVNSVCGCAAGMARPGVKLALQHTKTPDKVTTVFAGVDREATERARHYISGIPPSSPSIALFKDGKPVYVMERYQIEGRSPQEIAYDLVEAFDEY
jgi:putative YphP/YqiW family bacilliredoxin